MSKLGKKIQIRACVFTFSLKLEVWSLCVADLPRTGKKCTEIKRYVKGVQSFQAFTTTTTIFISLRDHFHFKWSSSEP